MDPEKLRAAVDEAMRADPNTKRFDLMNPEDRRKCDALGHRAAAMIEGFRRERRRFDLSPADWRQCSMDICITHMECPLRLDALLMTSDLEFFSFYVEVCRAINRPLQTINKAITIPYAQSSAH